MEHDTKKPEAVSPQPVSKEVNTPSPLPVTPRPKNRWKRAFIILLVIVLALSSAGVGAVITLRLQKSPYAIESGQDGNNVVTQQESDIAAVAAKVSPSVVSIITAVQGRSFYGTISQEGAGTGVIVSKDGYVMTNYHVVEGASSVTIVDSDGTEYKDVKIIGRDPLNDIAFLKITSGTTFTAAEIGDSATLRIGQQVVAIGNALGQYQNTVTSGILSGTGRPVTASSANGSVESLVDLLQTDASINAGNSGGPLLNLAGQVIGINTAVASDANGIGFAIPINATKGILKGVIQTGKIDRSFLGINYLSITPQIATTYDLPVTAGAYVFVEDGESPVIAGGPADKAGVKAKDIIQKINDATVGKEGGLSSILGQYQPGDTVTLTILRDNKTLTLPVTLGSYQPQGE